ncbi:MAG: imidazolonepropionase [Psychrosphaera sp.]|jgi:imidazolonepropionase
MYIQLNCIIVLSLRFNLPNLGVVMSLKEAMQVVDLVINNVHVMTMSSTVNNAYGLIQDGLVAIHNQNIVWVGEQKQSPNFQAVETVNGQGKYLSPGLIDCHTHLVFAGNRANEFEQRLTGVSYEEIAKQGGGIISTVKATRAATEQELLDLAIKRATQLMSEGVTSLEIKSGYGLDTDTEIKMLKVARKVGEQLPINVKTTFLGAHAIPPEFKDNTDGYIDLLVNETLPLVADLGLADAVDGFCENIGFSPKQMSKLFDKAKALNLPVKLHAEQLSDLSGAELVANYHGLSADHLEYLSDNSIKAMQQNNTVAVLLPGAFYTLSETKLPPITQLRQANVPIAIGSDYNPGSSPLCSLKLMLHMACTQFKLTPEETVLGVTKNAALALGLDNKGTIEQGQSADLCLWDIQHPAELAYTFGVNPLLTSWVEGKKISL